VGLTVRAGEVEVARAAREEAEDRRRRRTGPFRQGGVGKPRGARKRDGTQQQQQEEEDS